MRTPSFQVGNNCENRQKHRKRRSACVGQADFGKLELSNIRNDSGNSQRLSVLSVKRDQFETSLPADVGWGSFVTHSFLPHVRVSRIHFSPTDVGEN